MPNPSELSGLVAWYTATTGTTDGSLVPSIAPVAGSTAQSMVQFNESQQPIFRASDGESLPFWDFDGVDDLLSGIAPFTGGQTEDMTLFVKVMPSFGDFQGQVASVFGGSYNSYTLDLLFDGATWLPMVTNANSFNSWNNDTIIPSGEWASLSVETGLSGHTLRLGINGGRGSFIEAFQDLSAATYAVMGELDQYNPGLQPLKGGISEVFWFDRILTGLELAQMDAHMGVVAIEPIPGDALLTWDPPVYNGGEVITGYQVECNRGGSWVVLDANVPTNSLTLTDYDAIGGDGYRVAARNVNGLGAYINGIYPGPPA